MLSSLDLDAKSTISKEKKNSHVARNIDHYRAGTGSVDYLQEYHVFSSGKGRVWMIVQ